jgi:hypothetical protein
MTGILADGNIQGHLEILLRIWQGPMWREIWNSLGLTVQTFEELGLSRTSPDVLLWQTCQDRRIVFVTANRNDEGPESLESTIRSRTTAESLPVFTLASYQRIQHERNHARLVAEKMLEYLLDIEKYYGTGRLYVP